MLEQVTATRYVVPLREGGSLPGIVEACDLGTYVAKFAGAGQGTAALVAEVIVAGLAESLGLRVPRLVVLDLPDQIARYEADEEVQDLLTASVGANLGVDFLPGAFGIEPSYTPDPETAATVLWLDALVANPDRSWRNPNLLLWHGDLWCIDHGAALYFHHAWPGGVGPAARFAEQPYDVADHVFAPYADRLAGLDAGLAARLPAERLAEVVAAVPETWLPPVPGLGDAAAVRGAYQDFLHARVTGSRPWVAAGGAA